MAECINLVNRKNIQLYQENIFLFVKKCFRTCMFKVNVLENIEGSMLCLLKTLMFFNKQMST